MQIKTTGYHYKSIIMDKMKIVIISKSGKHAQKLDHSDIAGGNVKWYSHSGNSLAVSLKTKHANTMWPNNCTPGHSPREPKPDVHRNVNVHKCL